MPEPTVPEPTVLRAVLADYPHTLPLKRGEVTDPAVRLDFQEIAPVHKAFAPMVRTAAFDLSELAIVTALQAIAYDRPVVLLPAVVAARFQRGCLIAHASRPVPKPAELAGRTIGVRSFTQTTGMWVRTHLAADYGLAAEQINWLTKDPAHVEQYPDPSYVDRRLDDASLPELLRDGRIDAAIFGNDLPEGDELVPVIPDAEARDRQWFAQHGFLPINHMVVASTAAVDRDPDAIRTAYTLLRASAASVAPPAGRPNPARFGVDQLRQPIELIIDACLAQDLLPRELTAAEVFGPAEQLLGPLSD